MLKCFCDINATTLNGLGHCLNTSAGLKLQKCFYLNTLSLKGPNRVKVNEITAD